MCKCVEDVDIYIYVCVGGGGGRTCRSTNNVENMAG